MSSGHISCYSHTFVIFPFKNPLIQQLRKKSVHPLNKVPVPSSVSDFRPISIPSNISKPLRVVHSQLNYFLEQNALLNLFQSGFRSQNSTQSALLKILQDLQLSTGKQKITLLLRLLVTTTLNKCKSIEDYSYTIS